MSYDGYDENGNWRGDDDKTANGHECRDCGYVPTYAELHRGTCPKCRPVRMTKRTADRDPSEAK